LDLGIAEILYLDYEVGYEKAEISVTLDKKNLEVNEGENAVFQSKTLIRSTTLPNGSEEVPSDFITYQWYLGDPSLSGIALMDNSTYSGTDTSELTITEVEEEFHNNQYFVIATHEKNNCIEDVSGVTLAVYCISVYNKFTPNNDGINDNFTIKCLDHHPNNSLEIYNRWGDLVYKKKEYGTDSQKSSKTSISHSTSDQNSWDGTSNNGVVFFKNQSLPVGTYYYMIDFGDGREPKIGWVYLNR
jgi:gliding motility-associated-like protein